MTVEDVGLDSIFDVGPTETTSSSQVDSSFDDLSDEKYVVLLCLYLLQAYVSIVCSVIMLVS